MRIRRTLALGASIMALVSACSTGGGSSATPSSAASTPPSEAASAPASTEPSAAPSAAATNPTIRLGSDGFYEAKLMAEIYGQALEANGYTVDRTAIGIGGRKVSAPALESGQFDLKPEYIGSGLAFYDEGAQTGDPMVNRAALQAVLDAGRGDHASSSSPPAADQNAFVVRKETADQYKLTKMSDLTAVQDKLKFGVATDCPTNPICLKALKSAYGIDVANATRLDPCSTPMAQALKGKTIDVAELCSTQPDITINGWVVLEDDKATQPAENVAPLVRNDLLAKLADKAGFENILNQVSAAMDTTTLTDLGKQIAVDNKDIADVAKAWLQSKSLVQ